MHITPSDEMTTMLTNALTETLGAIRESRAFSTGDAMSAAMHVMIDAGMYAVIDGLCTREQLIADIGTSVREAVMQWTENGETLQ